MGGNTGCAFVKEKQRKCGIHSKQYPPEILDPDGDGMEEGGSWIMSGSS